MVTLIYTTTAEESRFSSKCEIVSGFRQLLDFVLMRSLTFSRLPARRCLSNLTRHLWFHCSISTVIIFFASTTVIMKGTKVHNPRAILSLLNLFLAHDVISKLYAIYM